MGVIPSSAPYATNPHPNPPHSTACGGGGREQRTAFSLQPRFAMVRRVVMPKIAASRHSKEPDGLVLSYIDEGRYRRRMSSISIPSQPRHFGAAAHEMPRKVRKKPPGADFSRPRIGWIVGPASGGEGDAAASTLCRAARLDASVRWHDRVEHGSSSQTSPPREVRKTPPGADFSRHCTPWREPLQPDKTAPKPPIVTNLSLDAG